MKTTLITFILIMVMLGCDQNKDVEVKSDPMLSISASGNFLFIGNKVINQDHIIRIPEPRNRSRSGRRLAGYRLYIVVEGSTASGFLGGSPTADYIQLFYGTKEECLFIQNQIKRLLK